MKFLLRLKAWQLFSIFMLPTLLDMVFDFDSISIIYYSASIFLMFFYVAWVYAIGTSLHALMPFEFKPTITYFKYHCWCLGALYILSCFYSIFYIAPIDQAEIFQFPKAFFIFMPFGFYLIFCTLIFAARMVESMVQGRLVSRMDSLKPFFWLWMFPIGLWFIQPSVQKLLNEYGTDSQSN